VVRADAEVTGLAAGGIRDREWMIVDRRGRFVTQREAPRLALVRTAVEAGALTLSADGAGSTALPPRTPAGGAREVTVWRSKVRGIDQGDAAAQWMSAFLDADVRVVRFDDRSPRPCNPDYAGDSGAHTLFADGYPLLVIGQTSLDDLNARLGARGDRALPMDRFRPNVVVEGLDAFEEDHVDTLCVDEVTLKLVKPCARCKVTTIDQATARIGVEPLAALSAYRRDDRLAAVVFGMNAIVLRGAGGALSVGAPARIDYRF
jgi:uncharacterized protein YcbX